MDRKEVMAIDLDDVVFDSFVSSLLILYNKKYNDNLQIKDITDYKISKFLKPECENIFEEFINDEFIENLVIPQNTIDALIYLNEHFIVKFVTAGQSYTMQARENILKKYLPFFNSSYLIMCSDKDLINYDIIIDDCLDNLTKWDKIRVCVKRPWNNRGDIDLIKYNALLYIDKFSDIEICLRMILNNEKNKLDELFLKCMNQNYLKNDELTLEDLDILTEHLDYLKKRIIIKNLNKKILNMNNQKENKNGNIKRD